MEEHNIFDSIQLAICVVLLLAGIAISVTGIAFWYDAMHPDITEVNNPDGSKIDRKGCKNNCYRLCRGKKCHNYVLPT